MPRRGPRAGLALFAGFSLFLLAANPGCGTDAKGVDDCRDIERARCEAAFACGQVTDLEGCRRFYRDQCLHGLAVTPPPQSRVEACVATLQRASACVKRLGTGATLADCETGEEGDIVTIDAIGISYACEVVSSPERSSECSFLTPEPIPEPDDEDGNGGESGSAGGRG